MFDEVSLLIYKSFRSHHLESIMDRIQRRFRGPVRAKVGISPGEVLSVVDCKVHVVQCVVRRTVDELLSPMACNHVAVVNEDGPNLDTNEEDQVQISLHRANENEGTLRF
jgi:hypothetical protein